MPYQLGLPNALVRFGLTVKVVDGWGTRGGSAFRPRGSVAHWTASSGGPTASLGVVTHGHSKLPGPLCNVYLDRYGVAWVVAAGVANHAGLGGYNGMSGNSTVFGTECEGTIGTQYAGTDFTPEQLDAYPRIVAAFHWLAESPPLTHACGHSEWTSRKIDVGSYAPTLRHQAAAILARGNTSTEDDMAQVPQDQWNDLLNKVKWLYDATLYEAGGFGFPEANSNKLDEIKAMIQGPDERWNMLQQILSYLPAVYARAQEPGAAVDAEQIAASIVDALPPALAEDVLDALVKRVTRDA